MNQESSYLFPIVLDILSNKPRLSENVNSLFKDIAEKLKSEGIDAGKDLLLDFAAVVDVGRSLGILNVRGDDILLPFLLKGKKSNNVRNPLRYLVDSYGKDEEDAALQRDTKGMNEIPMPPWMERDMRLMDPDRNTNLYRDRSRSPSRRNQQAANSQRGIKLLKRKRDA